MNSILIVDDHRMVRDGICVMLESHKSHYNFKVDEAENGEEAIQKMETNSYDVIIMDYQLPRMNGADTTKIILKSYPSTKVLALSNSDEYMQVENMVKSGALGFILKNIEPAELMKAIESVLNNQYYYSNEIAQKLIAYNLFPSERRKNNDLSKMLTRREKEILVLIAKQKTNEEIAQELSLSKRTVDTHRQNILTKLNVKNTAGLIKFAAMNNIIKSDW